MFVITSRKLLWVSNDMNWFRCVISFQTRSNSEIILIQFTFWVGCWTNPICFLLGGTWANKLFTRMSCNWSHAYNHHPRQHTHTLNTHISSDKPKTIMHTKWRKKVFTDEEENSNNRETENAIYLEMIVNRYWKRIFWVLSWENHIRPTNI